MRVVFFQQPGTTSACAENTCPQNRKPECPWNYLRVRGEYRTLKRTHRPQLELPPRARRIPLSGFLFIRTIGTTSACAENTLNELGLL